jgi:flagellar biosynthesis protein FlhA
VEDLLLSGLQQYEDGSTSLNIDPQLAQRLLNHTAESMRAFDTIGSVPILMCGSRLRWDLKKIVNRFIPGLVVLAFDEIPPDINTKNIGIITI